MERFCVSHDCHRLGCDVEMVQSNVGEWVGYDDASAEIAKLRAEVLGHEKGILAMGAVIDGLRSDLSAARAALDGEREALAAICDDQASLAKRDRCHAEAVTLHQIAVMIRARRAAEAQPKETPHA